MDRNSNDKKYKNKLLRLMSAYALVMLLVVITAITSNKQVPDNAFADTTVDTSAEVRTEYVYVKLEESNESADKTTEQKYIVREYMGKIGIFYEDGTLYKVIDTYVKTLPEADKRLLGEGIEIVGKQQLFEIIQDYS